MEVRERRDEHATLRQERTGMVELEVTIVTVVPLRVCGDSVDRGSSAPRWRGRAGGTPRDPLCTAWLWLGLDGIQWRGSSGTLQMPPSYSRSRGTV